MLIPALASILPAFLWMIYFYRSDRYAPEPKKLVARTFLVGALVGAAMVFSLKELPFYVSFLTLAVFIAPVTEETAKFLCVRWTVYNRSEFDEPVDGMVYATAAALGFASVENVIYVLNSWASGGAEIGVLVLTGRSVLSVPAHALFSSLWGLALGWHKKRKTFKSSMLVVVGLLGGMILHGLFNYLTSENLFGGLLFLTLMAIAWRGVFLLVRKALKSSIPTDTKGTA
ncbi:MAG: PrsW family intramembrane metalloprotease [Candidatus Aegiribacteria sp.]|nr:PrsW family intramembrane metalloprotease [Candidatus Aegiribacteria sp.]